MATGQFDPLLLRSLAAKYVWWQRHRVAADASTESVAP
jgi:hypothetical protein